MIKKIFSLIAVISLSNIIYSANLQADDLATFDEWLSNIENLAIERGISKNTADNALNNLERNPRVIELDRDQPEFTLTHEEYLNNTVTESRAKKGKDLYNEHKIYYLIKYEKNLVFRRGFCYLFGALKLVLDDTQVHLML